MKMIQKRQDLPRCPVCDKFPIQMLRSDFNGYTGELHQDILLCQHGLNDKTGMIHSELYVYATAKRGKYNANSAQKAKERSLLVAEGRWKKLCNLIKKRVE